MAVVAVAEAITAGVVATTRAVATRAAVRSQRTEATSRRACLRGNWASDLSLRMRALLRGAAGEGQPQLPREAQTVVPYGERVRLLAFEASGLGFEVRKPVKPIL
jgi:hypothetical protein